MNEWKITNNNNSANPPEIVVSESIITASDTEIDEKLPEGCRGVGTIIYSEDFSIIKKKAFDGSWIVLRE